MSLDIITSDALDTPHGFFTRKGGASSGIYAGLNCGHGSDDQTDMVAMNRSRVADALGATWLTTVHQTHSARAIRVETAEDTEGEQADALVTTTPGLAIGILTADCQPVLFADREAGVVGAAHAGWAGALGGVLEATVAAMEAAGAERQRINAVIGPSLSQRNYEVGPEFVERFVDEDRENARFFAGGEGDRAMFDLTGFGLSRLRAAGVGTAEWTGHCTYAEPERFFSYRRSVHLSEPDYGRLIAAIRL